VPASCRTLKPAEKVKGCENRGKHMSYKCTGGVFVPVIRGVRVSAWLLAIAMALWAGGPAFAGTIVVGDPDEAGIRNTGAPDSGGGHSGSYDCQAIILDDSNPANLSLVYDYYGTDVGIDDSVQPMNVLWLDKWAFDQDPSLSLVSEGLDWDFQVIWYGQPHPPTQTTALNTVQLWGEGGLLWTGTATVSGDRISISIPWDQLVDTGGNEAFPDHVLQNFAFYAKVDNGADDPDDRIPDRGFYSVVPEPATLLLLGGVLALSAGVGSKRKKGRCC